MATFLFTNNAHTTLAAPVIPSDTTIQLATGTGALFPNPSPGQQFGLSLVDAATGLITEITYCTARSGDNCTVTRAQEGTPALSWSVGDIAANLVTAAMMAAGISAAYVQLQPGNYAVDTGSTNAMVISLDPASANYASIAGAAIRVLKGPNTNTATCTINIDGHGPVNVILPNGSNAPAGSLPGYGILELAYNPHYDFAQLLSVTATGGGPTGPAGGVLSGTYPNPGFQNAPPDTVWANVFGSTGAPNWAPFASLGWSDVFGSPGYVIFPNGFIVQWGQISISPGGAHEANGTISFLFDFPNACFNCISQSQNLFNGGSPSGSGQIDICVTYDISTVGAVSRIDTNAATSLTGTHTIMWLAWGH